MGGRCYSSKWHFSACDHFSMIPSHVNIFMTTLHEIHWKSLKRHLSWRTHILSFGKVFPFAKTFQKTPKSENAQKYPKKMSFFVCTRLSLRQTRIRTRVAIYNSCVRLKYATFCIATRVYLLVYATVVSATHVRLLKMSKNYLFWNSGSLGTYATDSFSCNYFVFDPNSSLNI